MKNDKYAQNICKRCVSKLIDFYIFQEQCLQTHDKFKALINQTIHPLKQTEEIVLNGSEHFNNTVTNNLNICSSKEPILNDRTILHETSGEKPHSSFDENQFKEETLICEYDLEHKSDHAKYSCRQCNKVFRSKYGFSEHNKTHLDANNLRCTLCGKQFTR